jgi:hypothetical protein
MTAQHLKFAGGEWGGWDLLHRGIRTGRTARFHRLVATGQRRLGLPAWFSKRRAPQLDPFARRVHVLGVDPFLLGILGAGQHVRIGAAAPLARVVFQHRLEIDNKRLFEERICQAHVSLVAFNRHLQLSNWGALNAGNCKHYWGREFLFTHAPLIGPHVWLQRRT